MAGDAGAIRSGKAYVELGADDKGLSKALDAAAKKMDSLGKSIQALGRSAIAAGTALAAPFLAAAKHFADTGEQLVNMSARTGASVEALSALGFAAGQTGTDLASVEVAIKRMDKALASAAEGSPELLTTFHELGLSVQQLGAMRPEDQLAAIGAAMNKIQSPTIKTATALKLFGRSGTNIVPLLDNLQALTDEAKEFGLVVGKDAAEAGHKLGQVTNLMEKSIGALLNTIGSALAPSFEEWFVSMSRVIKNVKEWIANNKPLVVQIFNIAEAILFGGVAIVALGVGISVLSKVIGVLGSVIGGVTTIFKTLFMSVGSVSAILGVLLNPITLVVAGIAAAIYYFTDFTALMSSVGDSLGTLGKQFGELKEDATSAFKGMADAFKAGDIMLSAQILWAFLKTEWLKGVVFLRGVWDDWGVAIVTGFKTVSYQIAGFFADVWSGTEKAFVMAKYNIIGGLTDLGNFMMNTFQSAVNFIMGLWDGLGAFIQKGSVQIGAEVAKALKIAEASVRGFMLTASGRKWLSEDLQKIQDEADKQKEVIDKNTANKAAPRDAALAASKAKQSAAVAAQTQERDAAIAGIEATRVGTKGTLKSQEEAETEARRKESADAMQKSAADLAKAQEELSSLKSKAAGEAAGVKGITHTGAGGGGGDEAEQADKGMRHIERKVDVKGTFSAFAARGLGAGDTANETLQEQKKAGATLDKLYNKARQGRLVFTGSGSSSQA